jgi:hypothetical protein
MKNINATVTKILEEMNNDDVAPIIFMELDNTVISKLSGIIHNCSYKTTMDSHPHIAATRPMMALCFL